MITVRGNKFLIGRADECDLRPHSDAISRRHCVIIVTEKAVGVRDLKSRNGTHVNGEKITGDKRLRHGDTLNVGPLGFEIILEKSAKTTAPAKKQEISSTAPKPDGGPMGGMVSQPFRCSRFRPHRWGDARSCWPGRFRLRGAPSDSAGLYPVPAPLRPHAGRFRGR